MPYVDSLIRAIAFEFGLVPLFEDCRSRGKFVPQFTSEGTTASSTILVVLRRMAECTLKDGGHL